MTIPIAAQAIAKLTLDVVTSTGAKTIAIAEFPARWRALCIEPEPLWFGFVIIDAAQMPVLPGVTTDVRIAFLDDVGARKAFPVGASVLFGDGVMTRGSLVIKEYF